MHGAGSILLRASDILSYLFGIFLLITLAPVVIKKAFEIERKLIRVFFRGFGLGANEFRKAILEVRDGIDQHTFDAGKSAGGIYGKRAVQALTPQNWVAELYNPAVFGQSIIGSWKRWFLKFKSLLVRAISSIARFPGFAPRKIKSPSATGEAPGRRVD